MFKHIQNGCYYYEGSVNIGYVKSGNEGILIDAGIDRSSIKKVLKELKKHELPLTHLFITHAHADHYGGAAYLQQQHEVYTFAPMFEESILRNPTLEPLYLFGGNDPLPELQNKFLQGPSMRIDEVLTEGTHSFGGLTFDTYKLPGHSYHQLALKIDGVLYAADSYFGTETLKKHKIPYLTDALQALHSLHKLQAIECEGAVPGHGPFEIDPSVTIQENIKCHRNVLEKMYFEISNHREGMSHEQLVAWACETFEVQAGNLPQFLLYKTAVTGYLLGLIKEERVDSFVQNYRWMLKAHTE
ncbi:MBL fold metallo-hydrolase [Halobacillus litoralis]|uniref:MBL fold metallo-hydrolase n=1 Tax=Halobacillus litoralis TaxID=45668 RepID=UPI001CD31FAA|nr:MBL fold metallo-hydrolase [Halobacillus litoralis]MCA0969561.1 MBL fold metallo-hydrolase [Halobacillus litoralis]